eukprot:6663861-Prymnesium_polylepis.1
MPAFTRESVTVGWRHMGYRRGVRGVCTRPQSAVRVTEREKLAAPGRAGFTQAATLAGCCLGSPPVWGSCMLINHMINSMQMHHTRPVRVPRLVADGRCCRQR